MDFKFSILCCLSTLSYFNSFLSSYFIASFNGSILSLIFSHGYHQAVYAWIPLRCRVPSGSSTWWVIPLDIWPTLLPCHTFDIFLFEFYKPLLCVVFHDNNNSFWVLHSGANWPFSLYLCVCHSLLAPLYFRLLSTHKSFFQPAL